MTNIYEQLIEDIKKIDVNEIPSKFDTDNNQDILTKIIEEQKVYYWIRVFLKEEVSITPGNEIEMIWLPTGEKLKTIFSSYNKLGLNNDTNHIIDANLEDDKKCLCLLVNIHDINYSNEIPFLRTLFKLGNHYDYQLIRRDELKLLNTSNNQVIDWFDIDF